MKLLDKEIIIYQTYLIELNLFDTGDSLPVWYWTVYHTNKKYGDNSKSYGNSNKDQAIYEAKELIEDFYE